MVENRNEIHRKILSRTNFDNSGQGVDRYYKQEVERYYNWRQIKSLQETTNLSTQEIQYMNELKIFDYQELLVSKYLNYTPGNNRRFNDELNLREIADLVRSFSSSKEVEPTNLENYFFVPRNIEGREKELNRIELLKSMKEVESALDSNLSYYKTKIKSLEQQCDELVRLQNELNEIKDKVDKLL